MRQAERIGISSTGFRRRSPAPRHSRRSRCSRGAPPGALRGARPARTPPRARCDDERGRLHACKLGRADDAAGVRLQSHVEREHIGALEQILLARGDVAAGVLRVEQQMRGRLAARRGKRGNERLHCDTIGSARKSSDVQPSIEEHDGARKMPRAVRLNCARSDQIKFARSNCVTAALNGDTQSMHGRETTFRRTQHATTQRHRRSRSCDDARK